MGNGGLTGFNSILSVDGMPTYELYISKNQSTEAIRSIPGKAEGAAKKKALELHEKRRPIREAVSRIIDPILEKKILPFINKQYPDCGGACVPCFSLVRRSEECPWFLASTM